MRSALDRFSQYPATMLSFPRASTKLVRMGMAATHRFIGPYALLEQLGQGGMATVYRARHRDTGEELVVKAMLPHLARLPQLVEMFEAEARFMTELRHANIVRVHSYGIDDDDTPYLVMELLDGKNLSQLRVLLSKAARRAPVAVAVRIAHELCRALGRAHDHVGADGTRMQIVHRDVSPSNVMLQRDGSVKLLDFGVAKLESAAGHIVTSSLKGKFAYMAPEQVNQQPIDRRCDVFAAGIVLHEMLVGRRLFGCRSERDTLARVAACEVTPPSLSNADVPVELDAVVLRALSRDPADRFDSGDEMAAALAALGPLCDRSELALFLAACVPAQPQDPWMVKQRDVEDAARLSIPTMIDGDDDADEPTQARVVSMSIDVASIEIELDVERAAPSQPAVVHAQEWARAEVTVPERPRPSAPEPAFDQSWSVDARTTNDIVARRRGARTFLAVLLAAVMTATIAVVAAQGPDTTASEPAAVSPR